MHDTGFIKKKLKNKTSKNQFFLGQNKFMATQTREFIPARKKKSTLKVKLTDHAMQLIDPARTLKNNRMNC